MNQEEKTTETPKDWGVYTNSQASELLHKLLSLQSVRSNSKFNYFLNRNIEKLTSVQKQINRRRFPQQDKDDEAFMKEISHIKTLLSEKGIEENDERFKEAYSILADEVEFKYPKLKAKYEQHKIDFENFLHMVSDYQPYRINREHLSDLSDTQIELISELIRQ